jgi:hypothetical protein
MACCFFLEGLAYEEDLVANYAVWAIDTRTWTEIVEKSPASGGIVVVESMVYAYGWNDDFIIAKQHPNPSYDTGHVSTSVTNWFIIDVQQRQVYGPLSEEGFEELREELGVPEKVVFTRTVEP